MVFHTVQEELKNLKCVTCRVVLPIDNFSVKSDKVTYNKSCKTCLEDGKQKKRMEKAVEKDPSKFCPDCLDEGTTCVYSNCGYISDPKTFLKCETHKDDDMEILCSRGGYCVTCVDSKAPKPKVATWGYPDGQAIFCRPHIRSGMENVANKSRGCVDCGARASYGLKDGLKATVCKKHADKKTMKLFVGASCCQKCADNMVRKLVTECKLH